jgi:GT2 family glycosyltransferase
VDQRVEVSIVIPVFNEFHFTQACLASLQEHQGTETFEVIVVDDCSTDGTSESIPRGCAVSFYLRMHIPEVLDSDVEFVWFPHSGRRTQLRFGGVV